MRANIFYDNNNTSYYVDPASTSKLNCINLGGVTECSWPSGNGGIACSDCDSRFVNQWETWNSDLQVAGGVISRWGQASGSDLGLYSDGAGNWLRLVSSYGDIRFYTDGAASNNYYGGTPAMRMDANGDIYVEKLRNCSAVETNGSGKLICGVDDTGNGGGITGIYGGTGLSGGGSSGEITLDIANNSFTCGAANQSLKTINIHTGAVTCEADDTAETPSFGAEISQTIDSKQSWMPPAGFWVCAGDQIIFQVYVDDEWRTDTAGTVISDGTTLKTRLYNYNDNDPRTVYCLPVEF